MATKSPGLDLDDLRLILGMCVNFGVKTLKYRGLELEMGEGLRELNPPMAPATPDTQTPVTEITDEQHRARNAEDLKEEEARLRMDRIADLMLTDPKAAEDMILNGELDEPARDDDGDGSGE